MNISMSLTDLGSKNVNSFFPFSIPRGVVDLLTKVNRTKRNYIFAAIVYECVV